MQKQLSGDQRKNEATCKRLWRRVMRAVTSGRLSFVLCTFTPPNFDGMLDDTDMTVYIDLHCDGMADTLVHEILHHVLDMDHCKEFDHYVKIMKPFLTPRRAVNLMRAAMMQMTATNTPVRYDDEDTTAAGTTSNNKGGE